MIVMLFTLLSINLFGDFMRTGHVTGLLLLASESLVVVLTVSAVPRGCVDRSFAAGADDRCLACRPAAAARALGRGRSRPTS